MGEIYNVWAALSIDAQHNLTLTGIGLCIMFMFLLVFSTAILAFTTVRERRLRNKRLNAAHLEIKKAEELSRPEVVVINIGADYSTIEPSILPGNTDNINNAACAVYNKKFGVDFNKT